MKVLCLLLLPLLVLTDNTFFSLMSQCGRVFLSFFLASLTPSLMIYLTEITGGGGERISVDAGDWSVHAVIFYWTNKGYLFSRIQR